MLTNHKNKPKNGNKSSSDIWVWRLEWVRESVGVKQIEMRGREMEGE